MVTVPVVVIVLIVNAVNVVQYLLESSGGKYAGHVIVGVELNFVQMDFTTVNHASTIASQPQQDSPLKMENLSQCLNCKQETKYKQVLALCLICCCLPKACANNGSFLAVLEVNYENDKPALKLLKNQNMACNQVLSVNCLIWTH